jgi:hypothetical protein
MDEIWAPARESDGSLRLGASGTKSFVYRKGKIMSWMSKLAEARAEVAAAQNSDVWRLPLERLRGKIDDDGIERVSTQATLDFLGIPQECRGPSAYQRLAKVMTEVGWTAVRLRALTRGGYREHVRGYCRDPREGQAVAGARRNGRTTSLVFLYP